MDVIGYTFETPRSTVAIAGGMQKLLELFASRLRAHFRDHGEMWSVTVLRDYIEMRLHNDHGLDRVIGLAHQTSQNANTAHLALADAAIERWSPTHAALAALIADWPEISTRHAIRPPMPDLSYTEAQLAEARAWIVSENRASTSYIQRRLKIGYNKAAAIIERLEQDGVISPPAHDGKRQVLVSS